MSGVRADARKRSEDPVEQAIAEVRADAARTRAERQQRQIERRREVMQQALDRVYVGAGFLEADALLDALDDLGARVEVTP